MAATRLFAAKGFDGTSLQDIASAVGMRKPSLLYHFASKEQLRLAVLDELLERWNDVLPRLLMAATETGKPRFGSVMRELTGFFAEDPDRARLLMREILDRPEDMRRRIGTYVAPWITVIADAIRDGQRSGEIYELVDPEAYVLQVINMVVSGMATAAALAGAILPTGEAADRTARELTRIARTGLFREGALAPRNDESAGERQRAGKNP